MPIIILEGIDGSGKSTLATHLKKLSPWPATILKRGPIQTTVVDELLLPLFKANPNELIIADRWHLSELIYGPLYRGKSKIDRLALAEIEQVLNRLDVTRVVLQPSLDEVLDRLRIRGENFLKDEDVPLVYAAYQGFASMLGYTVVTDSSELQAKHLLTSIKE